MPYGSLFKPKKPVVLNGAVGGAQGSALDLATAAKAFDGFGALGDKWKESGEEVLRRDLIPAGVEKIRRDTGLYSNTWNKWMEKEGKGLLVPGGRTNELLSLYNSKLQQGLEPKAAPGASAQDWVASIIPKRRPDLEDPAYKNALLTGLWLQGRAGHIADGMLPDDVSAERVGQHLKKAFSFDKAKAPPAAGGEEKLLFGTLLDQAKRFLPDEGRNAKLYHALADETRLFQPKGELVGYFGPGEKFQLVREGEKPVTKTQLSQGPKTSQQVREDDQGDQTPSLPPEPPNKTEVEFEEILRLNKRRQELERNERELRGSKERQFHSETPPPVPGAKSQYAPVTENWQDWSKALNDGQVAGDAHNAMMWSFAWEGGLAKTRNDAGEIVAVAGVHRKTLPRYLEAMGLPPDTKTEDLTIDQRVEFYRAYFDAEDGGLGRAGGFDSLNQIGDQKISAVVADTLIRAGGRTIGPVIQKGVNEVLAANPQLVEALVADGLVPYQEGSFLNEDGIYGTSTLQAVQAIAQDPKAKREFLDRVYGLRIDFHRAEIEKDIPENDLDRYYFFLFKGPRSPRDAGYG